MEEIEKVKHSNKHNNDMNQASDFNYSDPLILCDRKFLMGDPEDLLHPDSSLTIMKRK